MPHTNHERPVPCPPLHLSPFVPSAPSLGQYAYHLLIASSPEFIQFCIPGEKCTLFVGNPSATTDLELKALFQPYGLVYTAKLFEPKDVVYPQDEELMNTQERSERRYGFVAYYTLSAAQYAFKELRKLARKGQTSMFVHFSRKRKREDSEVGTVDWAKMPLPIHCALELANHYLGYDTWSSSIVGSITRIDSKECDEEVRQFAEGRWKSRQDQLIIGASSSFANNRNSSIGNNGHFNSNSSSISINRSNNNADVKKTQEIPVVAMAYKCKVMFKFQDGHTVVGEGQGMALGTKADEVIPIAKKIAVTQARKDAFSRLIIVIFNNKVGVRVLAESPHGKPTVTDAEIDDAQPTDQPLLPTGIEP